MVNGMERLKVIIYLAVIAICVVAIQANGTIGQAYDFEDDEIEDFDERQGGADWFYNYYAGDYGDYLNDARATCKDSYPKNYWKKCNMGCSKLASRGSCNKKWSQAIGNSNAGKRCKNQLSNTHKNQKVKAWCKISCKSCANGGFSQWSSYGSCSKTCGTGSQTRSRTCTNPKPFGGGTKCSGCWSNTCTKYQSRDCNTNCCPVNGGYTEWGTWGSCSKTCEDDAIRVRERNCTNPPQSCGGDDCVPETKNGTIVALNETEPCSQGVPCPVNGMWGQWGNWSSCSENCGGGNQTRIRLCDSPAVAHGGDPCPSNSSYVETTVTMNGTSIQQEEGMQTCNEHPCPIDGNWGTWEPWGSCSVTCANGTETRTRLCDDPKPMFGGANCTSNSSRTEMWITANNTIEETDYQDCDEGPCPINGNWAAWGNWSECSSTCIGGMQNRNRTCSDPSPQYGGLNCTASNSSTVTGDSMMETETTTCNDIPCESDIFCVNMNADWRTSYGKCGADYGRCNPSHNSKFLYCDIPNSECTDDASVKTFNDYYDAYPEVACTTPCGPKSDPKAGVAFSEINACASTGGTRKGRKSAAKCWEVCSKNNGKYGIMVTGILWKQGTCGCISDVMMGQCEVNTVGEGYEYYEVTPTCQL